MMVLNSDKTSVTAVRSAANATLRISQIIYELKAVDEQTQDLLDSTNHISTNLQGVRRLRHQKSQQLDCDEKKWIDGVLADTDRCLRHVAALIEPARVDLQTSKSGRISLLNRGLWVFRDSPKVATNLARLNLTNQSLNTAMSVLCGKDTSSTNSIAESTPGKPSEPHPVENETQHLTSPPPSYNESESKIRCRMPRLSGQTVSEDESLCHGPSSIRKSISAFTLLPPVTPGPNLSENIIAELEATEILQKSPTPTINTTEVRSSSLSLPTESAPTSPNLFEGSDGLQVVEDCFDGLQVVVYQPYLPPSQPATNAGSDQYRRHSKTTYIPYRSPEAQSTCSLSQSSGVRAPERSQKSSRLLLPIAPPLPPRSYTTSPCLNSEPERQTDNETILPQSLQPGRALRPTSSHLALPSKDLPHRQSISSISIASTETLNEERQPNNDDKTRPRAMGTRSAPARVKSKGRAWLESQSEL